MSYRLWYLFSCIQRPHRSVNICIWLDYWYSLYLTFLLTPWLSSENMETYQATRNTPKGEKNNKFNHCTYLLVSRMTISQTQNKEPGNLTNTEALLSQFTFLSTILWLCETTHQLFPFLKHKRCWWCLGSWVLTNAAVYRQLRCGAYVYFPLWKKRMILYAGIVFGFCYDENILARWCNALNQGFLTWGPQTPRDPWMGLGGPWGSAKIEHYFLHKTDCLL